MSEEFYQSDLTDKQWETIEAMLPPVHPMGRPRLYSNRRIIAAILYLIKTGCQWRMIPKDMPHWQSCYRYFSMLKKDGTWLRIHEWLRNKIRLQEGRKSAPTAAIIDSQSVKSASHCGVRGYDAGKRINGRKRHILVDTLGLVLLSKVHEASIQDRDGARLLLQGLEKAFGWISLIWADGGYAGTLVGWVRAITRYRKIKLEIVKRSDDAKGFEVLPWRWVVERTFGWLVQNRRLARDYETTISSAEAMIHIAMIKLMLGRIDSK
jgi:putative transposase